MVRSQGPLCLGLLQSQPQTRYIENDQAAVFNDLDVRKPRAKTSDTGQVTQRLCLHWVGRDCCINTVSRHGLSFTPATAMSTSGLALAAVMFERSSHEVKESFDLRVWRPWEASLWLAE